MPYGYDDYYSRILPMTRREREAEMARIRASDEERTKNRRAWARLCGMASPIGGPSEH